MVLGLFLLQVAAEEVCSMALPAMQVLKMQQDHLFQV